MGELNVAGVVLTKPRNQTTPKPYPIFDLTIFFCVGPMGPSHYLSFVVSSGFRVVQSHGSFRIFDVAVAPSEEETDN